MARSRSRAWRRSTRAAPSRSATSRSSSRTASWWRWWGPRAAASPRCCACSPASRRRPRGTIRIGGRDVSALAATGAQRRDGVPGLRALPAPLGARRTWPFRCACAACARPSASSASARVAELLSLGPLLERAPRQLSGGERQRVAMGRALVREPAAFLLDEPLSNLDAKLRVQVRAEIAELRRRAPTTMLYVTHDQVEALTLGDRVAVLERGRLQQVATPRELYERPANLFVAGFIGSPPMNFAPARWLRGTAERRRRRRGRAARGRDAGRARRRGRARGHRGADRGARPRDARARAPRGGRERDAGALGRARARHGAPPHGRARRRCASMPAAVHWFARDGRALG